MNKRTRQVLMPFLRDYRWTAIGLLGLTAIAAALGMLSPLFIRLVIDRVITRSQHDLLPGLAICMLAVPLAYAVCSYTQILTLAVLGQKVVMELRSALYTHLLRLSMRFHGKHSVGMIVNRLMGDSALIQNLVTSATVQLVSDFVCAVFAVTATFMFNWRLAIVLMITMIFFIVNYRANIQRLRKASRRYRDAEDRLAGGIQNRMTANLTVKTFGAEIREHADFRADSDNSLNLIQKAGFAGTTFTTNTMLLQDIGRTVIYFLGCAMVLEDTASYGDVVAFTAYAMQLLTPAVRISMLAQQIQDVGVSIDRLGEFFEEQPEVISPTHGIKIRRAEGKVDWEHVTFHYEEGTPVLKDIDLHIRPGETVALVGPTGCGKTTVLSLLMRFFDVTGGHIRIDGTDLRDLDLHALRRQFGIVLQESLLFDVSIADNIRYSRPTATLTEVHAAAKVAEIHTTIEGLPEGYDSVVGRHGLQLSVGQKQRISIARAVLANPAILIMDEATSALDSESERCILLAMERVLHGRTAFIVAHRLSTIRNAHRIILLSDGHILEQGNHEQLMEIPDGHCRSLYNKHAGKGVVSEDTSS